MRFHPTWTSCRSGGCSGVQRWVSIRWRGTCSDSSRTASSESRAASRSPTFCHLQDQTDQLAGAYLNFCSYLSRIISPIALCAAIAAPELITIIYGPKWMPAAVPMQLLACGLLLVGLRLAIGFVYYEKNHPEFDYLRSRHAPRARRRNYFRPRAHRPGRREHGQERRSRS